jgi:hypothetical protein
MEIFMNLLVFWNHLLRESSTQSVLDRFLCQGSCPEGVLMLCLWHGWAGYGRLNVSILRRHCQRAYQEQGLIVSLNRLADVLPGDDFDADKKHLIEMTRRYAVDMIVARQTLYKPRDKKPIYLLSDVCMNIITYCRTLELNCSTEQHLAIESLLQVVFPSVSKDQIDACWRSNWARLLRKYPHFSAIPQISVNPI